MLVGCSWSGRRWSPRCHSCLISYVPVGKCYSFLCCSFTPVDLLQHKSSAVLQNSFIHVEKWLHTDGGGVPSNHAPSSLVIQSFAVKWNKWSSCYFASRERQLHLVWGERSRGGGGLPAELQPMMKELQRHLTGGHRGTQGRLIAAGSHISFFNQHRGDAGEHFMIFISHLGIGIFSV